MIQFAKMLSQWTKHKETPESIGVYLCNDSISMVHVYTGDASNRKVLANEHILCSSDEEKQAALQNFVQKNGLSRAPCHVIIELQDYKVTLLDTPPVSETEMIPSVRWMLKDTLTYPLDEACIDVFPIPIPRARDNVKLTYAVATPLKKMIALENMVKNAQLNLQSLSIPELALANALWSFNMIKKGSLLIYLHKNVGKFILIDETAIHMVRNIDLKDNSAETLILEIQRYLDYANTLFRKTLCTQCLVTPGALAPETPEQIKATLDLDTITIPFGPVFADTNTIPVEQQSPLFVALGSTLLGSPSLEKGTI